MNITVAGEPVALLSQRALFVPSLRTVLVADMHWGKAAAFRAAHIPIPSGTTANDLARLSDVLRGTQAQHLIVLGDLLHARAGRHTAVLLSIAAWRAEHAHIRIQLVRGNHDTHAGDPPEELDISCVNAPFVLGPFACAHYPEPSTLGYALAGHLHPHVSLSGRGRQSMRLPCFVFGERVGVLPAFSSFTGGGMYVQTPSDRIFAIADDQVIAV